MGIVEQTMWSFLRGDTSAENFEKFVYTNESIEGVVGKRKYLELLSAGYRDEKDIIELKQTLKIWLEANCVRTCACITWSQKQTLPLGFDTVDLMNAFEDLKKRNPWLELVRCRICGQAWYLATDTVEDDYHLLRLTDGQVNEIISLDKWPTLFDDFQNVWPDTNYPGHV